jgi:hypothetical protein
MSSLISLAAVIAMTAMNASAQTTLAPVSPRSAQPLYRSAFEAYRPFAEERLLPWKETNDTVGKIGGWRAYANEASADQPASGTASSRPAHGKH